MRSDPLVKLPPLPPSTKTELATELLRRRIRSGEFEPGEPLRIDVLTRELGPGGFGLVTIGTSLVICFSLVVDAGTEVLNLRDMARDPSRFRELAGPVLGLRLALSVLSAALLAATVALAVPARDRPTLLLFALLLLRTCAAAF